MVALSDASVVSVTPTTVSWSVTPVSSTAYSLPDVTDSSLTSGTGVSSSSSSSSSTVTQLSSDPPPPKYWDVQVSAAYLFMPTYCCISLLLAVMRFFFFFFEMPPASVVKVRGPAWGLSPLLRFEPLCNSMSPLIESIKCYFMPK